MNQHIFRIFLVASALFRGTAAWSQTAHGDLKIVLIRHAEKPKNGDNLDCMGLNRSLQLPAVLYAAFSDMPRHRHVPAMACGESSTKHCQGCSRRSSLSAVKYNLKLTSHFEEGDSTGIASDVLQKKGTVLIVWEHKRIPSIARALGLRDDTLQWPDDDYDSIWIIRFKDGLPTLTREKEGLHPSSACPF